MIEFGVLGQVVVRREGAEIGLSSPMLSRLLAQLLCQQGSSQSAEFLIDQLWRGRPPRTARKTLQVYIHKLRQLMGEDSRIRHEAGRYRMILAPEELDALRFESAVRHGRAAMEAGDAAAAIDWWTRAQAMWRGPVAFEGVDDLPAVLAERDRLAEILLEALADRIAAELDLGRQGRVVQELAQLLDDHPYRERLHALYLLALYRDGRQADALARYRALRERLATELGVDPSPELRALHQRLLNQDPALNVA